MTDDILSAVDDMDVMMANAWNDAHHFDEVNHLKEIIKDLK